ncbi:MAG: thiamine pyrophosphate-dependent enzyme, partial [Candidatus Margulisiibacteriota bacterium]
MSDTPKTTMQDLNANQIRWCEGCGNFSIINAVKKLILDLELDPSQVVNISGIGCSSRAPHYINTYGINGIHGRPIPIATGLKLVRPELDIIIHSGDGDAASIGGNHLLHGVNKNINCVFIMYDNGLYSLTKSQTSPTTPRGHKTNTSPKGSLMDPLKIMQLVIGMGGSFVASTADWLPTHLLETLK